MEKKKKKQSRIDFICLCELLTVSLSELAFSSVLCTNTMLNKIHKSINTLVCFPIPVKILPDKYTRQKEFNEHKLSSQASRI